MDGLPITPDRTVTFREYVTGNTLGYRVNKDKFITNGFMSWYALDRLNNRMEGNLSYKRLFIQDINSELTDPIVLNGEKSKVQHIGFRAVYTVEEYEVKMFEQKTGKLISSSHYKLYRPVHGEFALLDDEE